MAENKEFYLVIKGEKVIVSEEVYRAYKSSDRAERKRKQRMWRCRIIVPHEHTGTEVVVIDHCDLVRFFEYFFIASGFGGRPFQGLIRTGDSAFQLDVKVVMLPKLNDSFGKVHIDAESHTSNKMVIAIFKIISNSASKGLDILIVIGSFFFITPRQLCGPMPGNAHSLHNSLLS